MQYVLVKQFTFVKPTEENIWDFKFDKDSITFNDIMNFEHTGSTFPMCSNGGLMVFRIFPRINSQNEDGGHRPPSVISFFHIDIIYSHKLGNRFM